MDFEVCAPCKTKSEFSLRVKGKPMTKLMTGDLNVTPWVTALWTVTAWLSIPRWVWLFGLLSLAKSWDQMKPSFLTITPVCRSTIIPVCRFQCADRHGRGKGGSSQNFFKKIHALLRFLKSGGMWWIGAEKVYSSLWIFISHFYSQCIRKYLIQFYYPINNQKSIISQFNS